MLDLTPPTGITSPIARKAVMSSDLPDSDLLDLYLTHHDQNALDTLFSRYYPKVLAYIQRNFPNKEDAEDICQETYIKANMNLASLKKRASFGSWLFRIALNQVYSFTKSAFFKQRQNTIHIVEESDAGFIDQALTLAPPQLRLIEAQHLAMIFRSLNDEQAEAVILREIDKLSFAEIAQQLHISESAAKMRYSRGMQELRKKLGAASTI